MKVERVISVYNKNNDELIHEIIVSISLELLKSIINVDEDDPDIYKVYGVDANQYQQFLNYFQDLSNYKFSDFDFFVECFQITD